MKRHFLCSWINSLFKCTKKNKPLQRLPEYPVDDVFLRRQSLYALSGQKITHEQLMGLFEAAKWAPSEYNCQPWRFIYAHRETAAWKILFGLLVPWNQQWAKDAAALVVIISKNTFELNGKTSATHSFVTGAAWMNFALQATMQGIIAHGVAGFDYAKARTNLNIPDDYTIEAMCVVGFPGSAELLGNEFIKREIPSQRKQLKEIVAEASFTFTEPAQTLQP